MVRKAKFLPALAFSVTFIPIAEVAAIAVVARHDIAMFSGPLQHHRSPEGITVVHPPVSVAGRPAKQAGPEIVTVKEFRLLNRHAAPTVKGEQK